VLELRRPFHPIGAFAVASLLGSCLNGQIGGPPVNAQPTCAPSNPGPSPLRRMTGTEYNNTVRDLLGITNNPASAFPPDDQALGFDNNAFAYSTPEVLVEAYMTAAEAIATASVANLGTLLPCNPSQVGNDACAQQFIAAFGKRAWRRPLTSSETSAIFGVYSSAVSQWDFPTGIQLAMEVILQSPYFIYRPEFGMPPANGASVVQLTDYEIASRLSYLIWNSTPDDALLSAADANDLETPAQIEAQARRMLQDPRAHQAVINFHDQWLEVNQIAITNKDPTIFPAWTSTVAADLQTETESFVDDVIWNGDATVSSLLTSPYSFMNATLASYYGVTGVSGDTFQRVNLDPTQRAGFLTQGSLMSILAKPNMTSPVLRGKFVREQMLCEPLPDPPQNIVITPPVINPNATTREMFQEHDSNPACSGCHQLMDPIGFGFENYDGAGHWRTTENGLPIDASGDVRYSKDADGPFVGAVQLSQKLAKSQEVSDCVVTEWFRFGYGRDISPDDKCTMTALQTGFVQANSSVKELIVLLTQTDAFRFRNPVVPGSNP
jgi:hypothetical protein